MICAVWLHEFVERSGQPETQPTTGTATNSIAPSFHGHSAAAAVRSCAGVPRFSLDMWARKPAKIVTTPPMNNAAAQAVVRRQRRAQDGELALKNAERRRARHRQRRHAGTSPPVHGSVRMTPRDLAEIGRGELLLHVAGAEKHQRLGHGVKEHVQQRAERAQLAAEAERRPP